MLSSHQTGAGYGCVKDTNKELYEIARDTVHLIENCIKKYAKDESKEKRGINKSTIMEKASELIESKKKGWKLESS
jgi:hypothetical protein